MVESIPHVQVVMEDTGGYGYNPYALLLHNRSHHPPKGRNGGLYFRSFQQWNSGEQPHHQRLPGMHEETLRRLLQEQLHELDKEHPMLGVDAIHCECPEPQLLVLGYRCTVCLMANNKMKLEPRPERLQLDWEESDHERRQKLDKFDFTPPTVEKQEVFKNLRGEGWVDGCLGQKIRCVPAIWNYGMCMQLLTSSLNEKHP
ncbi:MAG TPA: hypothetical protein VNZ03_36385 [Terriglobales bacterium]|nr:hypothetical protein [Terriglobales bacterium]